MSGGGVHVSDGRGLRGLLDEVLQALEEEREHRRVTRRQLRGVEIPALVETKRSLSGPMGFARAWS